MIARVWRGCTLPADADGYVVHLRQATLPALHGITGHRGAYVLRRDSLGFVEFVVVTLWDSLEAIRAFAGDDHELAVVPPEAERLLADHDERAVHYDVALGLTFELLRAWGSQQAHHHGQPTSRFGGDR